ncbi:MAG: alpha/beta hydrolase [Tatlockia sp.]|nr:alpha/beta hydrolase [Tatlockia sp.]
MKQNFVLSASKEGYHRVAYREWGTPNEESSAIICVHGLTRNSHDFDNLAKFLSLNDAHVFCPDIVGRGDSSWFENPQNYNFEHYVTDMNNLISRTGARQIDWIGTSMGGIIGMIIASLPNSPIRRLILNDIGPQIPIHALWRLAKYATRNTEFKSIEEAKIYFKEVYADFGNLTEQQWQQFTLNSISEKSPGLFMSNYDPALHDSKIKLQSLKDFFHNPHKALEGIIFDIDLWPYWENIKCPVMVIRGKHSDFLLPEHLKKMKRTHSTLEVYEIDDAGHAPALLEPNQHLKIAHWLAISIQKVNEQL